MAKTPNGASNRYILNRALIERIAKGVLAGCPVRVVASSIGVSQCVFKSWLDEGRKQAQSMADTGAFAVNSGKHEWLCYELIQVVDQAAAQAFMRYQKKVDQAAKRDWKAAVALLDRFFKSDYSVAPPVQATITGAKGGGGVRVTLAFPDNGRGPQPTSEV